MKWTCLSSESCSRRSLSAAANNWNSTLRSCFTAYFDFELGTFSSKLLLVLCLILILSILFNFLNAFFRGNLKSILSLKRIQDRFPAALLNFGGGDQLAEFGWGFYYDCQRFCRPMIGNQAVCLCPMLHCLVIYPNSRNFWIFLTKSDLTQLVINPHFDY